MSIKLKNCLSFQKSGVSRSMRGSMREGQGTPPQHSHAGDEWQSSLHIPQESLMHSSILERGYRGRLFIQSPKGILLLRSALSLKWTLHTMWTCRLLSSVCPPIHMVLPIDCCVFKSTNTHPSATLWPSVSVPSGKYYTRKHSAACLSFYSSLKYISTQYIE